MEKIGLKEGVRKSMRKSAEQGKTFEEFLRDSAMEGFEPEEKLIRVGRYVMGCWMEISMSKEQFYNMNSKKGWVPIYD